MPRYTLRTLLILLAVGPIAVAALWFFLIDVFRPLSNVAAAAYLTVIMTIFLTAGLTALEAIRRLTSRNLRRK